MKLPAPDMRCRLNLTPPVQLLHFRELPSTNTYAAALIREMLMDASRRPEGFAISADRQTAGRGQYDRTFESPPGGVYVSLIIVDLAPALRALMGINVALGTLRALASLGISEVGLRWPNDLVLRGPAAGAARVAGGVGGGGRKVAGILCEGLAVGERWGGIAGVGINVATDPVRLPSGAGLLPGKRSVEVVRRAVIEAVWGQLRRFPSASELAVHDVLKGRQVELVIREGGAGPGERRVTGRAVGITPEGALRIEERGEGDARIVEVVQGSLERVDGWERPFAGADKGVENTVDDAGGAIYPRSR